MSAGTKAVLKPSQYKAISLLLLRDVNGLNYQEIAEKVGVSARTLQRWRNNEDFTAELIRQAEQIHKAFIAEAYVELRKIILSPDTADNNKVKGIELYLKNQGRLKDVQEQTVTVVEQEKSLAEMLAELEQ